MLAARGAAWVARAFLQRGRLGGEARKAPWKPWTEQGPRLFSSLRPPRPPPLRGASMREVHLPALSSLVQGGGQLQGAGRRLHSYRETYRRHHASLFDLLKRYTGPKGESVAREPGRLMRLLTGGRRLTPDDCWSLLGFFVVGTSYWAAIGSTSLVSVLLLLANTCQAQDKVARKLGAYISYATGLDVVFETAVVPKWSNQTIRMRNVKVCRDMKTAWESNYAFIDLDIEVVDVKISVLQMLTGRGLISQVKVRGVRGCIDDSHTIWTEEMLAAYQKRTAQKGDFEFEKLSVKDLHITLHRRYPDRPIKLEIFDLKSRKFRVNWLLYDAMTVDFMVGSFDGCLFSVQRAKETETLALKHEDEGHRINRFKIAGLNADLITASYRNGPMNWIDRGTFDITMVYRFPSEVYRGKDLVEAERTSAVMMMLENREKEMHEIPFAMEFVFNNLSAQVPFNSPDVSYMSNAMIQAIVAYFNTNYVKIPTFSTFTLTLDDFEGAWYPSDARVMEVTSLAVYNELVRIVGEQRKFKRVRELAWIAFDGIVRGIRHTLLVTWIRLQERL